MVCRPGGRGSPQPFSTKLPPVAAAAVGLWLTGWGRPSARSSATSLFPACAASSRALRPSAPSLVLCGAGIRATLGRFPWARA
eukprot:XP_001706928.1 Hypothetical protein GL50803_36855 [Giardia lamblia ATCC 50803]